jgi:hypothetical protein
MSLNYASGCPAACSGVSEHNINKQSIEDWLRRAKGSSRPAARRINLRNRDIRAAGRFIFTIDWNIRI